MKKTCLECGEQLRGRTDKKYCSDYCRISRNNRLNKDVNNYMRNVNNILRRNRRILKKLNPEGKIKVHRNVLLADGFRFNYMTNIYKTKSGRIYQFCYEYGLLELEDGFCTLVIKQHYVH